MSVWLATVGYFKNGVAVRQDEKGREHMLAHPEVDGLLFEAVSRMEEPAGEFWIGNVEFNREIGYSDLIEVTSGNWSTPQAPYFFFCQRPGRKNYTRVTYGTPVPSSTMVVLVHKKENMWMLGTAWIGKLGKKEPTSPWIKPEEMEEALDFWSKHALIHKPSWPEPVALTWAEAIDRSKEAER